MTLSRWSGVPVGSPAGGRFPLAGLCLFVFGAGAAATRSPIVVAVVPLAIFFLSLSVYLAVAGIVSLSAVLALAPIPTALPRGVSFAGGYVFWTDLLLVFAAALIFLAHQRVRSQVALASVGVILAVFLLLGAVNGAPLSEALADMRGPFRLAVAVIAVAWLVREDSRRAYLILTKVLFGIVIWTAGVVVAISLFGLPGFSIRTGSAALYTAVSSSVYDATRVTPDSGLACVIIAGLIVACWIMRIDTGYPRRIRITVAVCGLIVAVLSFTRSYVVVLAVLVIGATLLSSSLVLSVHRLAKLLFVFAAAGLVFYLGVKQFSEGAYRSVAAVVEAFTGRVFGGFGSETIRTDTSTAWRLRENGWAWQSFTHNWVAGTGFGVPYRGFQHGEIFRDSKGLTYVHSSYLWILVKTGVLGVCVAFFAFAQFVVHPLRRLSGTQREIWKLGILVGLTIGMQMVTSPTLFEAGNSMFVGLLVGLLVGFTPSRSIAEGKPTNTSRRSGVLT